MIPHELKIGDKIYDVYDNRWGIVSVLPNNADSIVLYRDMEDCIIGYDDEGSYCETMARDAYPLAENRYFWGNEVCWEINKDNFDDEHDYDFYCPNRDENCWAFEVA